MAWDDDYTPSFSVDPSTFQTQAPPAPVDSSQANTQGFAGDQADANSAAVQYNSDNGYGMHAMLYNGLVARGVPTNTALGFIGGQMGESGRNLDPTKYNPDDNGSPSGGFAQWHKERWTGLQDFAQQQGTSWKDPNTQVAYYFKELDSPEYKGMMDRLRSTDSLNAGVHASVFDFERPADKQGQYQARLPMAQSLANAYSNGKFMTSDDGVNGMTNQTSPISNTPFNPSATASASRLSPIGMNGYVTLGNMIGGTSGGSTVPGVAQMTPPPSAPAMPAPSAAQMPTNAARAMPGNSAGAGDLLRSYGQKAAATPYQLGQYGYLVPFLARMAANNQNS